MDVTAFLDQWGMLILTSIYVAGTLALCCFNYISNKLAKKQFDTNKPPSLVAYLFPNVKQQLYRIRVENEGGSCAYNVRIKFNKNISEIIPDYFCKADLLESANFSIGRNQYYDIILCQTYSVADMDVSFDIELEYKSGNNTDYISTFRIDLSSFRWFSAINNQECSLTDCGDD